MSPNLAQAPVEKDALYYPRIHIRNASWLKAALLTFRHVRRMAPVGYDLDDEPEVSEFREILGTNGRPMLDTEPVRGPSVSRAQRDLLRHLRGLSPRALEAFNRRATEEATRGRADSYQIHRDKLLWDLFAFLEENQLAWSGRHGRWEWVGVHPRLGAAIMSTIALAIAEDHGLDVVTDARDVHRDLIGSDTTDVFASLISGYPIRRGAVAGTDEVCQLVIGMYFDVGRLTPKDIAALVNDGRDLRSFRHYVSSVASTIPAIADPAERQRRLHEAARDVFAEWQRYKSSIKGVIAEKLFSVANVAIPKIALDSMTGIGSALLVAKSGVAIGAATFAAMAAYRRIQDRIHRPTYYLTRVHKKAPFVGLAGM